MDFGLAEVCSYLRELAADAKSLPREKGQTACTAFAMNVSRNAVRKSILA